MKTEDHPARNVAVRVNLREPDSYANEPVSEVPVSQGYAVRLQALAGGLPCLAGQRTIESPGPRDRGPASLAALWRR